MSKRQLAQAWFSPGERVRVTNHYITREDHPCFGTRESLVVKATSAGLTLDPGGHTSWPRAADIEVGRTTMVLCGHPEPGAQFLTIEKTSD